MARAAAGVPEQLKGKRSPLSPVIAAKGHFRQSATARQTNGQPERGQPEAEAVALANDTRYGLNAMLFTRDLSRAHRVAAGLRAGTVWVNCFFIRDLRAPFGGAGESGVGREGGNVTASSSPNPKPW